jgi:hypothetical protein
MPRASFAGVTFDFLLDGLQDTHAGMTTVREIPAGSSPAYIDLGGPLLARRTVTVRVDSEADYRTLAALPGTAASSGTLTSAAEGSPRAAVLLSVARTWRRGTGPQLCRTEWVFPT